MSGFPNNVSRAGFGPKLRDTKPVKDPAVNPSASMFELALFQIAGAGLMVPRGIIVLRGVPDEGLTSGVITILARYECWNSEGKSTGNYVAPTLLWEDVGEYSFTYGEVPDSDGNLISFTPRFPFGYGVNTSSLQIAPCTVEGNTVTTHLKDVESMAPIDGDVLVWFY